jgi:peptide chain release factor 2
MRERDELDVAVKTVRALESGIRDNVELIELGEAEGDQDVVREAENALIELKQSARRQQIETLSGVV